MSHRNNNRWLNLLVLCLIDIQSSQVQGMDCQCVEVELSRLGQTSGRLSRIGPFSGEPFVCVAYIRQYFLKITIFYLILDGISLRVVEWYRSFVTMWLLPLSNVSTKYTDSIPFHLIPGCNFGKCGTKVMWLINNVKWSDCCVIFFISTVIYRYVLF